MNYKVLIIAGTMNPGGIENQVMHLMRKSDRKKFHFDFTTTVLRPYYENEIEALGGKCIYIRPTDRIHLLRYSRELFELLKEGHYDIVHSHELFHSGIVLFVARLAGVKKRVAHAHNWTDLDSLDAKRPLVRKLYNCVMRQLILWNATDLFACSSLAGQFLYGKNINKRSNYQVINNSVDTQKYLDKYDLSEHGEFCEDGWFNILHVGRFCVQKNQLFLIEIAKEIKNRGLKARVLCAGDYRNEYGSVVQEAIETQNLQNYLVLLGNRDDVDCLLRKSEVFLLPSEYEGMPLALIEAQASGIPCVVSDTFSHEVDYEIGFLKWISLDSEVSYRVDEILELRKLGRANKVKVLDAINNKGFNSEEFARKVCSIYEGIGQNH